MSDQPARGSRVEDFSVTRRLNQILTLTLDFHKETSVAEHRGLGEKLPFLGHAVQLMEEPTRWGHYPAEALVDRLLAERELILSTLSRLSPEFLQFCEAADGKWISWLEGWVKGEASEAVALKVRLALEDYLVLDTSSVRESLENALQEAVDFYSSPEARDSYRNKRRGLRKVLDTFADEELYEKALTGLTHELQKAQAMNIWESS